MSAQKIVLINGSRLFRGMLKRVIKRAEGLEIAAVVDGGSSVAEVMEANDPDWAILSVDPGDDSIPTEVKNIIKDNPSVRLLVMRSDASRVRMLWNEPHELSLDGKDLPELLDILRTNGIQANIVEGENLSEYS